MKKVVAFVILLIGLFSASCLNPHGNLSVAYVGAPDDGKSASGGGSDGG